MKSDGGDKPCDLKRNERGMILIGIGSNEQVDETYLRVMTVM